MAKKRQQDFSKTQLKPGRTLTRRKNVAPTFKAKKIVMQGRKSSSQKPTSNIQDCLKSAIKTGSTSSRITALRHLEGLVRNKESLSPFLGEVLEGVVAKLLLETDSGIRKGALEVVKTILKHAEDESFKIKVSSYSTLFITVLSACMTHPNSEVRKSSLDLLEIILTNHPNLICNSFIILQNFQKLITDSPRKFSHLQYSRTTKSPVNVISSNTDNSSEYRIFVLENMRRFLKEMLKNFERDSVVEEDCNEQEVYWNCEGPLHLQLFAGGGLKPVDVEKCIVNNSSSQEMIFNNLPIEPSFIQDFFELIRSIFSEEIAGQIKGDDKELTLSTIKNLNVLLQVVCQLTELVSHIPFDEVDSIICKLLHLEIYEKELFPFKARGVLSAKVQQTELTELNLAVCFLHCKFLLKPDLNKEKYTDPIITYIPKMFTLRFEDKYTLIPMLVKILKRYYSLSDLQKVSDFVKKSLLFLSNLLKGADDHPNRSGLISLFIKLSLNPAYNFLTETEAMENWFNWILGQLTDIPKTSRINRNLLRIIKIVANRKYTNFLQALDRIKDHEYKSLMKYGDADVIDTVIFLIYNMEDIRDTLLEDVSNVILLDDSFPLRSAARLMHLLTCRFTEKLPNSCSDIDMRIFKRGREDLVQFLLNLAIDSLSLTNEKYLDYNSSVYSKAMEPFKGVTYYNIFPTVRWKKHSKLFEVCEKSLSFLPKHLVNNVAIMMFNEILESNRNIPMHTVIAMLKINNAEMLSTTPYRYQMDDLIFSSLLTTSVLTHISAEGEWLENNVGALMDNLELTKRLALESLKRQLNNMGEVDGISLFYILRIFKFYLDKNLFLKKDSVLCTEILTGFKEKCTDRMFKHQPMFTSLYNVFYFSA